MPDQLNDVLSSAGHTAVLPALEFAAAWNDLALFDEIVGDAQVVALGEGCHFVREFGEARRRLIDYLAERRGFTVVAFEFGFAEGMMLNERLDGPDPTRLAGLPGTTNAGLDSTMARWLFQQRRRSHPLRFLGLDIPVAGGSLRPALEPVRAYLTRVDPDLVAQVDRAVDIADGFAGTSFAVSAPQRAEVPPADLDELTAILSRLALRFDAMAPLYVERSDAPSLGVARRLLAAARHLDYMVGAMTDVFAGGGLPGDASVRDRFMADTVLWHVEQAPQDRVVVVAHNNHVQKTPVVFGGELAAYPLGYYLHEALGTAYRAVALTHTADRVPEMEVGSGELGFTLVDTAVPSPSPGSVERFLVDLGLSDQVTLTSLRPTAGPGRWNGLSRIRAQSEEQEVVVADAFDGVLSVPSVTQSFEAHL